MSEGYLGEIRMFAGTYPPRLWAFCDGQLLSVNEYQALFSLLGTAYGGDGRTTFAVPDMRGRIPVHFGQGEGLSPISLGQRYGVESVTLSEEQLPVHSHGLQGSRATATQTSPQGQVLANSDAKVYSLAATDIEALDDVALLEAGGGQAHSNMMPSMCLNFIICTHGGFPSRN